jgi:eukaryotic-like serine/threonine-protein kinase
MNAEQRVRRDELFEQLADLSADEQQSALEAACGGDSELMDAVNELLLADGAGHPLLDSNAVTLADELLKRRDVTIPGRVGRYVIRERLGQGGMGTVYLAEREGLGDRVAIKFLRHTWSSDSERRRFASEQCTLAALNHRHIARLYDSGVLESTPWFVMEWVAGASITAHCREHACLLAERLRLFRSACEAVSYAHRMLIVHRDLKPSNILVNSDGEVKLVDFGIAKHLGGGSDTEDQTTAGLFQLSLNYAAPEQIRGETAGIVGDVYSLGVVLYELLTGLLPANLSHASVLEMSQWLDREIDPPSLAAARRQSDDSPLTAVTASPSIWRDLDLLTLTACHKQKDRRYRSVDDLIRDVDHLLRDEPLEAHPENLHYRFVKFISRNRRSVAAGAVMVVVIFAISAFFTWRLVSERNLALASQARTERIHRLMLNLFEGDDEAAGPADSLRVVTLLDRGAAGTAALASEPAVQADLQSTLGDLYHKLGKPDRAEPLLRSAFDRRVALLGGAHPDSIRSEVAVALFLVDGDRTDEAERLARDALSKARQHHSRDRSLMALATLSVGQVASAKGAYHEAVPLLEEAVKLYSPGPPTAELSDAIGALANTEYYLGRIDVSESLNERGLAMDKLLFGDTHPHVAVDLFNLGNIALDRGEYGKGEDLFRQSLRINTAWYSSRHPKTAADLLMVGRALDYLDRNQEASVLYGQALDIYKSVYGENHLRIAQVLNSQGALSLKLRKLDDAEQQFSRAADIFKKAAGEKHPFYAHQLSNLGAVYIERREYTRAKQLLQAALDLLVAAAPDQRYTAMAHIRMAQALAGEKRYEEAEPHAIAGFRTLRSLAVSSPLELKSAREILATIYAALHQPEKMAAYGSGPAR